MKSSFINISPLIFIVGLIFVYFVFQLDINLSSGTSSSDSFDTGYYEVGACETLIFQDNGTVEYSQRDCFGFGGASKSCLCYGTWSVSGSDVVVNGLSNPNCSDASRANGKYKLAGKHNGNRQLAKQ